MSRSPSVTLRAPVDWLRERHPNITIVDADGWRDQPWEQPVTVEEFERRLAQCTVNWTRPATSRA